MRFLLASWQPSAIMESVLPSTSTSHLFAGSSATFSQCNGNRVAGSASAILPPGAMASSSTLLSRSGEGSSLPGEPKSKLNSDGDATATVPGNRSTAALKRIEAQTTDQGSGMASGPSQRPVNGFASSTHDVPFIDQVEPRGSGGGGPEHRLQTRIQDLIHERDSYQDLLRDAVSRIFLLESRLKLEEEHPQMELLQQKALEIYKRSKANISALHSDISDLRQLYKSEKNAKDNQRLQLVACQKEMELAKTTLKMQENALEVSQDTIKRLTTESFGLQQALATTQATLSNMKQDRNMRMKDDQSSVERNLILAQKCDDLEKRANETMVKLEEAVEFGEKAVRARDHLASRLRDYVAEINEMRDQEMKNYTELTERSRREIQHLKNSSEEALNQLRDEIRILETKLTEKDIEFGRAQREVKALQMQVERAEREALISHSDMSTPEDLFRRLSAAEQDRDRLSLLVQSTQALLRQKIDQMSQREEKFEKSMRDQNERLKETINQCEKLNNEHVAMAEEIQRLEGQLGLKEKSLQVLNREIQSEIYTMKEKGRLAEADRTARDAAMEESQKQSLLDMQQVNKLLRQQVAHWQAEFNNLQNNHETRLRQMKDKLSQAKQRQYELELEVQRHSHLNSDLVGRLEGVKNTMVAISNLE